MEAGLETITIAGEELILHPFKAIYWPAEKVLFIADLHLGKATHFRKSGIAVPAAVEDNNLEKLTALFLDFKPKRVLFLGDLFHSDYNSNWEEFGGLITQFHPISFELVPGNHDIMNQSEYEKFGIVIQPLDYRLGPFMLRHHPTEDFAKGCYHLCGHVHPGVRLRGYGRQSLRLPCFFFGTNQGILPAFGEFTGYMTLKPAKADQIFVVVEGQVMAVS